MSLGSRLAKRGRTAAIASLASTPREPLSFLYPAWSIPQPKAQARDFSCTAKDQAFRHLYIGKQARPFIIKKLIPTKTKKLLLPGAEVLTIRTKGNAGTTQEDSKRKGAAHIPGFAEDSNIDTTEPQGIRRVGSFSEKDLLETTEPPNPPLQNHGSHTLSGAHVARIVQRKLHSQRHALRKREARLEHQNKRKEEMMDWGPDWREILGKLCKVVPVGDKWLEEAVEIFAPENAVDQLLYSIDDNIWEISARHDASISLDNYDPLTDEYRRLLLSGTESAIRKATADIAALVSRFSSNSLVKRMEVKRVPISVKATRVAALDDTERDPQKPVLLGSYDGTPRHVLTQRYDRIQPSEPDKIPELKNVTRFSLYDYVWKLATTTMPNHLHGIVYEEGTHDVYTRVEKLKDVLQNPDNVRGLSRAAFNLAMQYCVHTNQISAVKHLFSLMDKKNISKSVDTFNIMLDGTARQGDLYNFNFIFHIMLKRRIRPNGKTWALLMKTIPDIRIKLYILHEMKERGLLRPLINIKRVAVELCPAEIEHSLDIGESQDKFLAKMDERYTPWWLTSKSGNQILHALGSRGLISRCWDFLYIMQDRSIKIDHNCVNTILTHCKVMRNINGLLEVLRCVPQFFSGTAGFVPNQYTYDVLFEAAWRGRRYNLAKVIWRYACMNGATTRDMRLRVYSSFQTAALSAKESETRRQPWYRSAGFFIFNAHPNHLHPSRITRDHQDLPESARFKNILARFRTKAMQNFECTEKTYLQRYLDIEDEAEAIRESSVVEDISYSEDPPIAADAEAETFEGEIESELDASYAQSSREMLDDQSPEAGEPETALSFRPIFDAKTFDPNVRRWAGGTASTHFPLRWNKHKYDLHIRRWLRMMGLCKRNEQMVFQNWQPARPFDEMLTEAWALDREWERLMNVSLHAEARTMKWKLENAIQVPIKSKDPHIGMEYIWK